MPDTSKLAPAKAAAAGVRRRVDAMEPVHRRRIAVTGGGLLLLLILVVLLTGGGDDRPDVDLGRDATPIAAPDFGPAAQRITAEITTVEGQIQGVIDAGSGIEAAAATEASDGARDAQVQLADLDPPASAAGPIDAVVRQLRRAGRTLDSLSVAISAGQPDRVERFRTSLAGIKPELTQTNAALKSAVGG